MEQRHVFWDTHYVTTLYFMAKTCLIKIFLWTLKGKQIYSFGMILKELSVGNHGIVMSQTLQRAW